MTLSKFVILMMAVVLNTFAYSENAFAQDEQDKTVSIWVSEVQNSYAAGGWSVVGRFATYQEASACSLAWSLKHSDSLKITREREVKVPLNDPIARMFGFIKKGVETINNAREQAEPKERERGDTLKEYRDKIKESFDDAMNAKQKLTSLTGNISGEQYRKVIETINSFNEQHDKGISTGISFAGAGIERIEAPNPRDLRKYLVILLQEQEGKSEDESVIDYERTMLSDDLVSMQNYVVELRKIRDWKVRTNVPEKQQPHIAQDEPDVRAPVESPLGKWMVIGGPRNNVWDDWRIEAGGAARKPAKYGPGNLVDSNVTQWYSGTWTIDGDILTIQVPRQSSRAGTGISYEWQGVIYINIKNKTAARVNQTSRGPMDQYRGATARKYDSP